MEKPKICPVPLEVRCVSVHAVFGAFTLTGWRCYGRGVEAHGRDPESAYRLWRGRLAEKKRLGILDARHRRWQDQMIEEGNAYRRSDGTLKWRRLSPPVRKAEPARQPSFWEKVFGK